MSYPYKRYFMMQEYNGLVKQHSSMKSRACNRMKCSRTEAKIGDRLLLCWWSISVLQEGTQLCLLLLLLLDLFTTGSTAPVATALFRTDQISHLLCRLIFCPQK